MTEWDKFFKKREQLKQDIKELIGMNQTQFIDFLKKNYPVELSKMLDAYYDWLRTK
jgi:hypothetical protein